MGSLIFGCLGALGQKKLKGFIAYTSINQMGYPLIALSLNTKECLFTTFFYLIIYIFITSFFFFLVFKIKDSTVNKHYKKEKSVIFINQLRYLHFDKNLYMYSFLVVFFSMAGIPPLAGFFGKYLILLTLLSSGLYFSSFFLILISVISAFYYLKILKILFFDSTFTKKELNNKLGIIIEFNHIKKDGFICLLYMFFVFFFIFIFNIYSKFIHCLIFGIQNPFVLLL